MSSIPVSETETGMDVVEGSSRVWGNLNSHENDYSISEAGCSGPESDNESDSQIDLGVTQDQSCAFTQQVATSSLGGGKLPRMLTLPQWNTFMVSLCG